MVGRGITGNAVKNTNGTKTAVSAERYSIHRLQKEAALQTG